MDIFPRFRTESAVDFKEATDRLIAARATLEDVAEAVDRDPSSVGKARLDPDSSAYRSAPPGWEKPLAKLARARARDLMKLAEELER